MIEPEGSDQPDPSDGLDTSPDTEIMEVTNRDRRRQTPERKTAWSGARLGLRGNTEGVVGDFTATPALLRLVPLALVVGALGAGVSLALLDMIGFFTNLFYYQRLRVTLVSPYGNTLGAVAVIIPVGGGLIIGLMARFGSEQIRGHGIPEAMERILVNGSRVQPRLAVLKPISSAISIGTGGPFGAEGPTS